MLCYHVQMILFMNAFQLSDRAKYPRDDTGLFVVFEFLAAIKAAHDLVSKSPAFCLELRPE